jgi:hypothetical protein
MGIEAVNFEVHPDQVAIYNALVEFNRTLSTMYLGSLYVLNDSSNPDRLSLAAHSLRELMEKLPKYLDLPVEKPMTGLKERIRILMQAWHSTKRGSGAYVNSVWAGNIDRKIVGFFEDLNIFFTEFEIENPNRKEALRRVLRAFDPLPALMPRQVEDLRIKQWGDYNGYFQGVSHHTRGATEADFRTTLSSFEKFLLDYLCPRTYDDFTEIDEIIREAE